MIHFGKNITFIFQIEGIIYEKNQNKKSSFFQISIKKVFC